MKKIDQSKYTVAFNAIAYIVVGVASIACLLPFVFYKGAYLLLSSGQPVDLLFTADWTNYQQYAKKGAFLALDEIVPKYAPQLTN